MVEKRISNKYVDFISKYDIYFPKGIKKKDKMKIYSHANVKTQKEMKVVNKAYNKLKNQINKNI